MSRGVGRTVVCAALVTLVPFVVATVARAGTDDETPGLVVTSPVSRGFEAFGAMRLRAIGSLTTAGDEYVGVADLGVMQNRIEANFTAPRFLTNGNTGSQVGDCQGDFHVGTAGSHESNEIRFEWDRANDALVARLTNDSLDCTLTFVGFTQELASAKGWGLAVTRDALAGVNALLIDVDGRQEGASVVLRDATVDGAASIGTLDPGPAAQQRWLATGYDFDNPGGFHLRGSLDLAGGFGECADTCGAEIRFGRLGAENDPPEVVLSGQDANGPEGSTLATGGAFTDPNGDPLQLSASGAGTLVDQGDGTWSWTLPTDDDGAGSVVVTASDGKGGETTDRFEWSATNVAPTITSLEPSSTSVLLGAEVIWTASASDPGTADELTWTFDGGAGTAVGATTTYRTSYAACGTYTLDASVTDDDGGIASATSASSVTATGASVLEPVSGPIGQPGRTLPIKVRIGCGDANLTGLQPEVWYQGVLVGTMREQDDFYRFNLALDGPGKVLVAPFGVAGGMLELTVRFK